jgi:hypothetical protein
LELGKLVSDLSRQRLSLNTVVHLDPDLHRTPAKRLEGWRPALGQTSHAQSHLEAHGVGVGDVFLFFGWFRSVELVAGRWRYASRAPNLHVVFGWLEIDGVLPVVKSREKCLSHFPWIADHPHLVSPEHYTDERNTLYIAARRSTYANMAQFGGGQFERYVPKLQLTRPGSSRSVWSLPNWFMPEANRPPLSYHGQANRWTVDESRVTLRSVAKGQEFVLDVDAYPEAEGWIREVIRAGTAA